MSQTNVTRIWDFPVRFFHWTLVVLFAAAYITGEEAETVHAYLGYGIIGLIVFRIIWGFIGTKYARFSDFIYGPTAVFRYLKQLFTRKPVHYLGHNPAAGWMVLLLLISVMATCWSGLEAYGAKGLGPLANMQSLSYPRSTQMAMSMKMMSMKIIKR